MSSEISINFYFSDSESENVDAFVRKVDKNTFVQTTIISYDRENLKNDTLWEQFKEDFVDWIEDDFKSEVLNIRLRRLQKVLRKRDVWVLKDAKMIIAKSLIRIFEKEHLTLWIEEEIVNSAEKFNSDVIDNLRKIDFDRNLIDYLWQTAQSRSESRKSESQLRESSLRERSTQKKFLHHSQSLNKEKLSIRKRSSVSHSIRQRSSSSQSIRHRSSSSIFESLKRQRSLSIELQNVQSITHQFIRWDSSIKILFTEKITIINFVKIIHRIITSIDSRVFHIIIIIVTFIVINFTSCSLIKFVSSFYLINSKEKIVSCINQNRKRSWKRACKSD
jgi:hypothetical protein